MTSLKFFTLTAFVAVISGSTINADAQQNVAPAPKQATVHSPEWNRILERDILWKKRVWRTIDIRDKGNEVFLRTSMPGVGNNLVNALIEGIKKGGVQAFNDTTGRFLTELSQEELTAMLAPVHTMERVLDASGHEQILSVTKEFNPALITKFKIKEDWLYDEVACKVVTRILGIAPMKEVLSADGNTLTYEPMFWVYYPNSAKYLAQNQIMKVGNEDGTTWYDLFETRDFSSSIDRIINTTEVNNELRERMRKAAKPVSAIKQ